MPVTCSRCGIRVHQDVYFCPLCDIRLERPSRRRRVLWAMVALEYSLLGTLMLQVV